MQNRKADAVSEIIATVLLLAVAVSVFSVIYVVVLSAPMPSEQSTAIVAGDIIDNQIVLTHQGGKSLTIGEESYQIQTTAGEYSRFVFDDINNNGLWDIGEQVRFTYDDLTEKQVTVTVVDVATNDVVLYGVLQEGKTIIFDTVVQMLPFTINRSPYQINATGSSQLDSVSLYYRWSNNNFTGGVGDWWNTNFSYRQKFNISEETSTETNIVVPIAIQYGYGISSDHKIYCNESCQSDFDDIRFTNANGTELDYFREMYDDGYRAMYYIQIDWLPTSGRDFYIYYGDDSVTTTGNASNTFILWEDFEETSHIFDSAGGTGISPCRSSDYSIVGSYSGHNNDGSEAYKIQLDTSQSFDSDYFVSAWVYNSGGSGNDELGPGLAIFGSDGSNAGYQGVIDARSGHKSPQMREEWDYGSRVSGDNPANTGQWYYLKITTDSSNVYCTQYTVSGYWNFTEWDSVTMSDSSPRSGYFGLATYNQDSSYWDAFRVARNIDVTIASYDAVEYVPYSTEWAEWSDASNPDTTSPWSWNFDFPNSTGYYEFFSIGEYDGRVESAPSTADTFCYYNEYQP